MHAIWAHCRSWSTASWQCCSHPEDSYSEQGLCSCRMHIWRLLTEGLPLFDEAPHARQQVIPSCQDRLPLRLCQPNGVLQGRKLALDPQVCTRKALRVCSRLKQHSCSHGLGQHTSKQQVALTPGDERRLRDRCAFQGAVLGSGYFSSEPGHHGVAQAAMQASPRRCSSALLRAFR